MMDDEQKIPEQDETTEGQEPEAAGPVSDSGLSLPGESSESSPPARGTALEAISERVGEDVLITARFKEW
jgi:hypothetical protein